MMSNKIKCTYLVMLGQYHQIFLLEEIDKTLCWADIKSPISYKTLNKEDYRVFLSKYWIYK